tara:strand:- start:1133 stop:1921 length:789 start_codon:yes stop_codon:yes gene_type:complete
LPGKLKIIKRKNLGASYSTNQAVKEANGYWIRLLDGDDLVTYKSTEIMLFLAKQKKVGFVYGLISENINREYDISYNYKLQSSYEGLMKFIKNCPANSSALLVSKEFYFKSGGCNENFVSPDQVLFLRLFSSGPGVFLKKIVAKLPKSQSLDRLSSQISRSRYESILALINFCSENSNTEKIILKKAFQRALSRANTYNKFLNNRYLSNHFFNYVLSKVIFPNNYKKYMYNSLKVFTGGKKHKPRNWYTGSEKMAISKKYIK